MSRAKTPKNRDKKEERNRIVFECVMSVIAVVVSAGALVLSILAYTLSVMEHKEETYYQGLTYDIEAQEKENPVASSTLGMMAGIDLNVIYEPITGGIAKVSAVLFRNGVCQALLPLNFAEDVDKHDEEAYNLSPVIARLSKEEYEIQPSSDKVDSPSDSSLYCSVFLIAQGYQGEYSVNLLIAEYGLDDENRLSGEKNYRVYAKEDTLYLLNAKEGQTVLPSYDEKMLRLFVDVSEWLTSRG